MKQYKIQKETELYLPVKKWFESAGFTVHAEVKDCDLTAIKDSELIIAEFKRGLTIELLLQGVSRQKSAEKVYIVIQKPSVKYRKFQDILYILKKLDLGLLLVDFEDAENAVVEEALAPEQSFRVNKKSRKRRMILKESTLRATDENCGGCNQKKLLTLYRERSVFIACCLEKFGELSPEDLRKLGSSKRKTGTILTKNYYGWFTRIKRGRYGLSDEGKKALVVFSNTADFFRNKLKDVNKKPI